MKNLINPDFKGYIYQLGTMDELHQSLSVELPFDDQTDNREHQVK